MSVERANELMKQADETITDCTRRLEQGVLIDLSKFEELVREFCDVVVSLRPDEQKPFQAGLQRMIASLQFVAGKLEEKREMLKKDIESIDKHRGGHLAYAKHASPKKEDKKSE